MRLPVGEISAAPSIATGATVLGESVGFLQVESAALYMKTRAIIWSAKTFRFR